MAELTALDIFNATCEFFTAVGTCGAVIVSLYLTFKERPHLSVTGYISLIVPSKSQNRFVTLTCINKGKIPITLTGLALSPNIKKPLRIMLLNEIPSVKSDTLPLSLNFSERASKHYLLSNLEDGGIKKLLGRFRWLAKIKLKYFWRIVATTNIKEFSGKLCPSLVNELLNLNFCLNKK